jgi:uncharacterized protein (TIGR02284 family)
MEKDKSIDVLNTLITINNDRIEGYETASKETDEQDLKALFDHFSETSRKCKEELVNEVKNLGGTIAEGTKTTGKFFRVWMDVKAALTGKDRKAILNSCEFGEDNAVDTYEKALADHDSVLTAQQQILVKQQLALIKADHDKVKSLRDALVEAV